MNRTNKSFAVLTIILAGALFLPSYIAPSAHAQLTGLVCITPSPTATSCPTSQPTIGPLTVGQTFTVGVFIQGSGAMTGFDIYVASDNAFVRPISAAVGTLIASPAGTSICVNGSALVGGCVAGTANGPGFVDVTTADGNGANECGSISPCSGMAFTITYQVLAASSSTSLAFPAAVGCIFLGSSVSSPPNTCVSVVDNLANVLPENIQGLTITIAQEFAVNAILSTNTIPQGASVQFSVDFGRQFSRIQGVCFDFVFTLDLLDPGDSLSIYSDQFLPYGTSGGFGFINLSPFPQPQRTLCLPRQDFVFVDAFLTGRLVGTIQMDHGSVTIASLVIRITGTASQLEVSKFFTDSSFHPLAPDSHGNPMVNVALARGVVESTNPGQVLTWVNVNNTDSTPLQSLQLNETLPIDWTINPTWLPAKGAIQVYFANTTSLATNPEITQPKAITVTTSNPQTVTLSIKNFNATGIGHPLLQGQSILLAVKLSYGLKATTQSFASYPRNYTDTANAVGWTQASFKGAENTGTASAFFIAYAKVAGDPGGETPIILVSKYALT